jgi:hypothetical protein
VEIVVHRTHQRLLSHSLVGGRDDIFVMRDLEAGMLAKQLEYLAEVQVAGILFGRVCPSFLRAVPTKTLARFDSCAIVPLLGRHKMGQKP